MGSSLGIVEGCGKKSLGLTWGSIIDNEGKQANFNSNLSESFIKDLIGIGKLWEKMSRVRDFTDSNLDKTFNFSSISGWEGVGR